MDKNYNKLTPKEEEIIINKGTEKPFSGKYNDHFEKGYYLCKRCGAILYSSKDKFESKCGWPSFDDEMIGAVKKIPDDDKLRTEILCANCGAHLGHVFEGEGYTKKNVRHCVNSITLNFVPKRNIKLGRAIFAGGCFWGVEYHMKKVPGVIEVNSGYIGGKKNNPSYEEVKKGTTGHLEAVEVIYDAARVTYEKLVKLFFEIHDPTQEDGQGPDIGEQYKSVIFYLDQKQKEIAEKLIDILKKKGYHVATQLRKATIFWRAEEYHQNFYEKKGGRPYCHVYTKRFDK